MRLPFFVMLCLVAPPVFAQPFPFDLPFDDASKTILDNSALNPAPLQNSHRLRVRNGHFADQTGRRVRLLGTNFTTTANFPTRSDAAKVAARMHKFGFNIVRLHHLDASWSNPSIFGENHDGWSGPTKAVALDSLKKLDGLVAELGKNGIYANLNLHVARRLTPGDGFENTEKLPEMGKVLAYFEPRFIALQKDYARQILRHKNSVTGRVWADDPTIAFIELNNEDTLVGEAWSGVLQGLPQPYRGQLQRGWNAYLKQKYSSTGALKNAWKVAGARGENLMSNARFEEETRGWVLETQDATRAQISVEDAPDVAFEGRAMRVSIEELGGEDWKIQVHQPGLNLREGELYTARFWAKSDANRRANASFGLDQAPWSNVGGWQQLQLSPTWKKFSFVFRAKGAVPNHVRFSLAVGGERAAISLADFSLVRGEDVELDGEQKLENATIDLPQGRAISRALALDWLGFLSQIENRYVTEMTAYIKNYLGYKGLVTCSQASYGGFAGILRESKTDFIDMHAYWQHPEFPNRPWDPKDWRIKNTPMTDDNNGGTLADLAAHRVAGKPFTVSEYNHPAPNDFASETIPAILGFAGAQDWDGVYIFGYNGNSKNWNPGRIRSDGFNADSDPNKMVFFPVMARAFLRGEIGAATRKLTLQVGENALLPATFGERNFDFWGNAPAQWRALGFKRDDLANSQIALQIVPGSTAPRLTRKTGASGGFHWKTNGGTGQIVLQSPTLLALVGRISKSGNAQNTVNGAQFLNLKSNTGWATVTLGARDSKPLSQSKSLLLTILGRAENQGMGWNAERTSVGDQWGQGPALLEVPSGRLELETKAKTARVWALSPTGGRGKLVTAKITKGVLRFDFSSADKTAWYEIALS